MQILLLQGSPAAANSAVLYTIRPTSNSGDFIYITSRLRGILVTIENATKFLLVNNLFYCTDFILFHANI